MMVRRHTWFDSGRNHSLVTADEVFQSCPTENLMKTILTLVAVLLTASAADAKCRLSRTRTTNRVVTVQTPAPAPKVETKVAPVAGPTLLPGSGSGCASGNCGRTTVPARLFRLLGR